MKANGKMVLIWLKAEWRTVLVTRKTHSEEKCSISPAYVLFSLTDRETPSGFGEAKRRGLCNSVCWRKILFKCLACQRKEERTIGVTMMTGQRPEGSATWGPTVLHSGLFWDGHKSTWTLNKELLLTLSCCRWGVKCLSAPNLKQLWKPKQKVSEWDSLPFSWAGFLLKNHCIHIPRVSPVFPTIFITDC